MELAPGDVVQLKSGGPRMTIEKVEGAQAVCAWMDRIAHNNLGSYQPQRHTFASAALIKVEE
ncbi:DUF2158 domain-containing protein [Tianweitania sediminis]|uniref:DUF2158 domain-containing protein n=2 Tax=Tianweitania sediminis TaxID=1502156 RepID=A0A8J7R0U4_9HYPH|nr:DUF2158 domain-containing protein [Tianweitania sediminis]